MIKVLVLLLFLMPITSIYAADDAINGLCMTAAECGTNTTVIVTEEIPGGNCRCDVKGDLNYGKIGSCSNQVSISQKKYTCTVPNGLVGFQSVFASLIRYFIYIIVLLGVLGIVGLGIAWAFAGGDDVKAKTTLKKWGVNIIIGLTILFLFSYILRFIAPWVYK